MVVTRRAWPDDAASIAGVHVQSWQETYAGIVSDAYLATLHGDRRTETWSRLLQNPDSRTYVADDEGQVVGFVNGGPARDQVGGAELMAIYVLKSHQRLGLGRELTTRLFGHFKERGYKQVVLWVLVGNPAVSFYEHLGGARCGEKLIDFAGQKLQAVQYRFNI